MSSANSDALYQLAVSTKDDVEKDLPGDDAPDVELHDFMVDFLKSGELASRQVQPVSLQRSHH